MDSFSVEFTVHRIGGSDRYERAFYSQVGAVYPSGLTTVSLPGVLHSNSRARVEAARWVTVRPGLMSAMVTVSDLNSRMLSSPRPVLLSTLPSDVPLYSSFPCSDPDEGVYSVGLRIPRNAWAEEDLAMVEQA